MKQLPLKKTSDPRLVSFQRLTVKDMVRYAKVNTHVSQVIIVPQLKLTQQSSVTAWCDVNAMLQLMHLLIACYNVFIYLF